MTIVKQYFASLKKIIFHPGDFFRSLPLYGGISGPLAFALVTHWISASFDFLSARWAGMNAGRYYEKLLAQLDPAATEEVHQLGRHLPAEWGSYKQVFLDWVTGVGSVLADPFFTLFGIFFSSAIIFLVARVLVTPGRETPLREVPFEGIVRFVSYSMAPAIFSVVPGIGGFVGRFYGAIVLIIAVREGLRIGGGRAFVVAMAPGILVFFLVMIPVFFIFFGLLGFFVFS